MKLPFRKNDRDEYSDGAYGVVCRRTGCDVLGDWPSAEPKMLGVPIQDLPPSNRVLTGAEAARLYSELYEANKAQELAERIAQAIDAEAALAARGYGKDKGTQAGLRIAAHIARRIGQGEPRQANAKAATAYRSNLRRLIRDKKVVQALDDTEGDEQ